MKLAMFSEGGSARMGVVEGGDIVDVTASSPGIPRDLYEWLQRTWRLEQLESAVRSAPRLALSQVRLLAPIACPRKYLGIGANYESHLSRLGHLGLKIPPNQVWFNKQTSCVTGPFDPLVMPRVSSHLDYEGELVVVIGRRCRHVAAKDAPLVVAGFTVGNDASVRDWQMRAFTMTLGKSFDTHGPIGPWLVTPDELGDPHRLAIRTWVNGQLRQDGSTSEMRYSVWEQIEELTKVMTLEPGDLLCTGTPAGTALENQPPTFLTVGDVVRIEIEGIGAIENTVVADKSSTATTTGATR